MNARFCGLGAWTLNCRAHRTFGVLTAMARIGGRYELTGRGPSFEFLKELGESPLGSVWLARCGSGQEAGRLVTVRRVPKADLSAEELRAVEEVTERSSTLVHPAFAKVLRAEQTDSELLIVGEHVDGVFLETLRRMAGDRDEPLPAPVAVRIVHDVLRAALVAREQLAFGSCYRLVFAEGAFVAEFGDTLLTDVGVLGQLVTAAAIRRRPSLAARLTAYRTLSGPSDEQVEVFAAGVLLWELIANRRLFAASAPAQAGGALQDGRVPELTRIEGLCRPVDEQLASIVQRATAHRLRNGFSSLRELLSALRSLPADRMAADAHVSRSLADLAGPFLAACRRSTQLSGADASCIVSTEVRAPAASSDPGGTGGFAAKEGPTLPTRKLLKVEELALAEDHGFEDSASLVLATSMGTAALVSDGDTETLHEPAIVTPPARRVWARWAAATGIVAVVAAVGIYWADRSGAEVTVAPDPPTPAPPAMGLQSARQLPTDLAPAATASRAMDGPGTREAQGKGPPAQDPTDEAKHESRLEASAPKPAAASSQDEALPAPERPRSPARAFRPRGIEPYHPRGI